MLSIIKRNIKTGSPTVEIKPDAREFEALGAELRAKLKKLGRSLHIREVDAGSCNGCELEITGLSNPVYDIERFGVHFVASPRHADVLLVAGPVTKQMKLALQKTYEATPDPRIVIACGECAGNCGVFKNNYAVAGPVDSVIPVDIKIPGCPPEPAAIIRAILSALDKQTS
ncbi:MAG: NADH-quinone oxidoreductase subunit B family protein [Elusimicrobiaceae bacterium]